MIYLKLLKDVLINIGYSIIEIFSRVIGYIGVFLIYLLTTFGDKVQLFNYILICMIIDLLWGMLSNYVRHTFGLSKCLVQTAIKMAVYLSIFTIAVIVEQVIGFNSTIFTRTICTVLCCAEGISIIAHILIVNPNFPVLKLLKKYFIKEIARKLDTCEDEVINTLNKKDDAE